MARYAFPAICLSAFLVSLSLIGGRPASTEARVPAVTARAARYRSAQSQHKVIVDAHQAELREAILGSGGSVIEEYGGFTLLSAPDASTELLSARSSDS